MHLFEWMAHISLLLMGLLLFALMIAAGWAGYLCRRWHQRRNPAHVEDRNETQQGYVVGAALTLLGLLIGFTFALVVDRYETRRQLVLEDANAIEALYLHATLLDEPHRARISRLVMRYVDNRVLLGKASPALAERLLDNNHQLLRELWRATMPAFQAIRTTDFSTAFVDSVNHVIELNSSREAARSARVPELVFAVLFLYSALTAGMLGYILDGRQGRIAGCFLLFLFTVALILLSDFNRPVDGSIRESQAPMESLRTTIHIYARALPEQPHDDAHPR